MHESKYARYTSDMLRKFMDIKVEVTRYNFEIIEAKVTRYVLDARSISPNSHHTPSISNFLNATPLSKSSTTKPASKEASLKGMKNYPKIYKGKANLF